MPARHRRATVVATIVLSLVCWTAVAVAPRRWRNVVDSVAADRVPSEALLDAVRVAFAHWKLAVDESITAAIATSNVGRSAAERAHFQSKANELQRRSKTVSAIENAITGGLNQQPLATPTVSAEDDSGAEFERSWPIVLRDMPRCPTVSAVGPPKLPAYGTTPELLGHLHRDYNDGLRLVGADDQDRDAGTRAQHWAAAAKLVVDEVAARSLAAAAGKAGNAREIAVLVPGTGVAGFQHYLLDLVGAWKSSVRNTTAKVRLIGTECSLLFLAAAPWLTNAGATLDIPPFDSRSGGFVDHYDSSTPLSDSELTVLRPSISGATRTMLGAGLIENTLLYGDVFGAAQWGADAHDFPCADIVATSYVVDAVTKFGDRGGGVPFVLERLRNLTCVGGLWVNYGPFAYHDPTPLVAQSRQQTAAPWSLSDVMMYLVGDAFPHASTPRLGCAEAAQRSVSWALQSPPQSLAPLGYTADLRDSRSSLVHGHRPVLWGLRRCS